MPALSGLLKFAEGRGGCSERQKEREDIVDDVYSLFKKCCHTYVNAAYTCVQVNLATWSGLKTRGGEPHGRRQRA